MDWGDVQLVVDYGTTSTVAVLHHAGGWQPLLFDGAAQLPSGVWADGTQVLVGAAAQWRTATDPDRWRPEPLRELTVTGVDGDAHHDEVVGWVAAVLRRVGEEATAVVGWLPGSVVLVAPPGWGPRRRMVLRAAARRAGLPEPVLVDAPVAVARRVLADGVQVPVGWWVAVCDVGATFTASVVHRTPPVAGGLGFEVVSTVTVDAGGRQVDDTLTAHAAAAAGGRWSARQHAGVRAAVTAAKTTLPAVGAVSVPLPTPAADPDAPTASDSGQAGRVPAAVVLTVEQLHQAWVPVLHAAVAAAKQAVTAAEVPADRCAGVFCVGAGARHPAVAPALGQGLGSPAVVLPHPELAAATGAVPTPTGHTAPDGGVPAQVVVPPLRRVFGIGVPAALSLTLVQHFAATADLNAIIGVPQARYVLANWGQLGLAGLMGMLACLAAATILGPLLHPGGPDAPGVAAGAGSRTAAGLLGAVGAGSTIAGVYAIAAALYLGMPNGPFIRWAVLPSVPVAAAALTAAGLLLRARAQPGSGWHGLFAFPTTSLLCAAAGMISMQQVLAHPPFPTGTLTYALLLRLCAAGIGAGIAVALADTWRNRLLLTGPLVVLTAGLAHWSTTGLLATLYALAVAAWWTRRLWRLRPTRHRQTPP